MNLNNIITMGNVCCVGRFHPQGADLVNTSDLNHRKESRSSRQIPLNEESIFLNQLSTKPKKEEKTLDIKNFQITESDLEKLESSIDANNSSLELEFNEKYNTVNVHSQKTEIGSRLNYKLITLEDLSQVQQSIVSGVLNRFQNFSNEEDPESVDGFANVIENGQKYLAMVTTHAIYLLNPDNLEEVCKWVKLEDIHLLGITKKKEAALFVVKEAKQDFCLLCENLENFLMSIEEVSFEAFNQYIPWIVFESFSELDSAKSKVVYDEREVFSDENLAIVKVIVENGGIGEIKNIDELCSNSGENKMMNIHFVLTDLAIYVLDSSYGFKSRIPLINIEKISVNHKDKYVIVFENSKIYEFFMPLDIAQIIVVAASKIGKKIKLVNDF